MFGKKKTSSKEPSRRKGADLMNQMGFAVPGMPDMDAMGYDDDDDEDLEAELAELAGEDYKPTKAKAKRKAPLPMSDIEKMAAAGMEDIDEDVSDSEDPSLLAELEELQDEEDEAPSPKPSTVPKPTTRPTQSQTRTAPEQTEFQRVTSPPAPSPKPTVNSGPTPPINSTPSPVPRASPSPSSTPSPAPRPSSAGGVAGLIEDRLNMYKQAFANAKASGDSSKQRRLDRSIKTLTGQLRQAKAGKPVSEDEIPPPVAMGTSLAVDSSSASSTETPNASRTPSQQPQEIQHGGSNTEASQKPPNSGQSIQVLLERRDQYKKSAFMAKQAGDMTKAGNYVKIALQFDSVIKALEQGQPVDLSKMPPPPPEFSKKRKLFNAPENPKTVMEALTQRLAKFQSSAEDAKKAGDGSKTRRMGRVVKQYEDAIKSYKAGRPVNFDELPSPPGFAPIPVSGSSAPHQEQQAPPGPSPTKSPAPAPAAQPATSPRPVAAAQTGPQAPQRTASGKQPVQRQSSKKITSRSEQQLAFLKERMEEFKQAAISAKKKHDLELAKKYVRIMKGLEPMIDAAEGGLPVDLAQVPLSPFNTEEDEDKFVVVAAEDCKPTGDREEVFKNLHTDLLKQIQICVTNAQHYQKLGDVPAAAKFQKLEQGSRKDLQSLKSAQHHGDPAPRFHYEVRSFSMVKSNTDLGDADMEITIIRGIQYNLPSGYSEKDMDTFVKYEMAYPTDEPQSGSTGTVKDTVNPEYNESFKLQINRTSKGFFRFIERKALKIEIFIKRGFLKSDKLLGTVSVKLLPLERQCTLHESYDLMDGRKSAGGKLELKIRVRDPFKNKQVDEVKEKWLVIDQFIRTVGSKSHAESKAPKTDSGGTTCMEVLRMEKQLLDKQISQLKDSLSVTQTHTLKHKSSLIQEKIELQQKKLREGGIEAWKVYMEAVTRESVHFEQEARQFVKLGEVQKAELLMTKKKYADKELAAIKAKMSAS